MAGSARGWQPVVPLRNASGMTASATASPRTVSVPSAPPAATSAADAVATRRSTNDAPGASVTAVGAGAATRKALPSTTKAVTATGTVPAERATTSTSLLWSRSSTPKCSAAGSSWSAGPGARPSSGMTTSGETGSLLCTRRLAPSAPMGWPGAQVSVTVALPPSSSCSGSGSDATVTSLVPSTSRSVTTSAPAPVLPSVTALVAVAPAATSPKSTLRGAASMRGARPCPVSATSGPQRGPQISTSARAAYGPPREGRKSTSTVVASPASRLSPSEAAPPTTKPAPSRISGRSSRADERLVTVRLRRAEAPTATEPKSSAAGSSATSGGSPVPVSGTSSGVPSGASMTMRPWASPSARGAKVTVISQNEPGASGSAQGAARAKASPSSAGGALGA